MQHGSRTGNSFGFTEITSGNKLASITRRGRRSAQDRERIFLEPAFAYGQARIMGVNLTIRKARPTDAEAVARIYVESWRDTYPLVLPARLLSSMTVEGQSARWRNA